MEKDNVEIEKVDDKTEYDEIITKEDRDFSSKQEKKIFRNIIFVAVSNIITLLAGVLVGFVIPKILTITDYGYYKIFTMYFAYTGLFHFGFCDGIFLYFAGKKYDN